MTRILLFIRAPVRGKVKSRLAKAIGDDMALDIYKYLVCHTLKTLEESSYPFSLCYYPPDSEAILKNWLGSSCSYVPQHGADLGKRMENAFIQAFADGMDKVVLVGSDIPRLSVSIIGQAFNALATKDAVIGPAHDGGYYLIGFNRSTFLPDIFQGIAWSTDSVYNETMNIFDKAGFSIHVLAGLSDVDTLRDLLSSLHGRL